KILKEQCSIHPVIRNLYISDIGFYPKAKGHYREREFGADEHILIYVIKGKGLVEIGAETFELKTGNFIFIPAKSKHLYEAHESDPWSIYWIHFLGELSENIIEMMLQQHTSLRGTVDVNARRSQLFNELYLNLERGYSMENLCYVNMSLLHFLSSFIYGTRFNQLEVENREDSVNTCINFMQDNLHKSLTLQEIATTINLSPSHFSYIFRHRTGFSPIEYFNHLKIQKACQYLLFTDLRIKEIADQLGLADPYYFSRLFSKLMGIAPIEYRTKRLT
ncbi:MAG TPA: AraC family transcriptional regulator, partial [Segetibacter sp.]